MKLRALEPEDINLLYEVENDEELWSCGNTNAPFSRYSLGQYIATCMNDVYQDHQLRLVVEEDEKALAIVDLIDFDTRNRRAEVGIVVLKDFRRKGVGKKVLKMLEEYVMRHCPLHQLYAYVTENNEPAMRLFQSSNFNIAGMLNDWRYNGEKDSFENVCVLQKMLGR